ncbi:U6 snRNA-associated Sm-like protein LSm, putative [Brugia malayi]|uniref:U6 snRNA-associated Sm-like protein LSm1 n=1 Tax=Brugia malayi TaxID=6279 RepID=A0A4E9FC91_BRUMA|nr:U6 snRNA-associated Sm-like protein LSm, putative [Brugia malayi]VIO94002.1 U6 snRNA-associated Sm-like protein LSm, putative [Brugia malayi]
MDLPDPYLPGALSLLEQLDKKLLVVLRDGRTLIGYLRTIDQFANLVLHETLERIHVDNYYGDIERGVFLIRGENVVLAGLIPLSAKEILSLQQEKIEEKERFEEARNKIMKGRGRRAKPAIDVFNDES